MKLALAVTCVNATLLVSVLWTDRFVAELSQTTDNKNTVKVVSANVLTSNAKYQKALQVLTRDDPDIIALTETNDLWIQSLRSLEDAYPYSIKHPRSDNFGMAVFSKNPFDAEIIAVGKYKLPLGVLNFEHFDLLVAHPLPPISRSYMQDNRRYIAALSDLALNAERPVLIAGDLNSTIYVASIKPLMQSGLEKVRLGLFSYTWPTHVPLLGIQIDHFFSSGIVEASGQVLSGIGSDHYPIQATFKISHREASPAE